MAKYGLTADLGQRTDKGTLITEGIQEAAKADIRFVLEVKEDNTNKVKSALNQAVAAALEEIGQVAERFAKAETPVDTGRLRNSITHVIEPSDNAVYIGTNVEYAPYIEHGSYRGGKMQGGVHMLQHAAENHASFYGDIVRKHLKNP